MVFFANGIEIRSLLSFLVVSLSKGFIEFNTKMYRF